MTKSEAKAIHECASRALRKMNGTDHIALGLPMEHVHALQKIHVEAIDEVQRIADMVFAELHK